LAVVGAVLALAFLFRASLWREAGMFYLGDDNLRAQACFERALLLRPDDEGALAGLGVAYGELGYWQEAVATFERGVAVNPKDAAGRYNLGVAYANTNRREDAIRAYQAALHVDPSMLDARLNLGLQYVELDRPREALTVFQEASKRAPNDPEVQYELGVLYAIVGETDKAKQQLDTLDELDTQWASRLRGFLTQHQGGVQKPKDLH